MNPSRHALSSIVFLALAVAAHAQQMPNMPGMPMPPAPAPKQQQPARSPGENPRARAAEQSIQNSEAQQRATQGAPPTDAQSLHHNTATEQEFEAPGIHTGTDLPASELLTEAAQRPALTLPLLEAAAEATSPTLAEARALVQRSKALARQAALPPNPIVGYSGEHLRGGSYGGGENGAFAEQTFVLGGKLALRKGIYLAQSSAQMIELEAQTLRLHSDIERAFYDALTAQAEVDIRRKLLVTAEDAARTAHELANLGQQDAPEVLDAEVETEQARLEYEEAERLYIARFATLAAVAGRSSDPLSRLEGDLENPPQLNTNTLGVEIAGSSPILRASQQQVAIAQAQLRDAHREAIPNLRIQAGAWYSGEQLSGTQFTGAQTTGAQTTGAQTTGFPKPAGWMGFAQAGVQLPLWNRNQGNIAAAQAELSRTQAEAIRTRLQIDQRIAPLVQRYQSARSQAERYRDAILPRAQRAHDLYVLKYGQMAAAYPQVLLSERTYLRLRLAYLGALNEEWRAAIALRNNALEGGLEPPTSQSSADTTLNLPTGASD